MYSLWIRPREYIKLHSGCSVRCFPYSMTCYDAQMLWIAIIKALARLVEHYRLKPSTLTQPEFEVLSQLSMVTTLGWDSQLN